MVDGGQGGGWVGAAGRVDAGQSLQFYVEAVPVRLPALLEHSRTEAERTWRSLSEDHRPQAQVRFTIAQEPPSILSA